MVNPASDSVIGSISGGQVNIVDYILNQKTPPGQQGACPNAVCPGRLHY
jgi:hypothetical protein